MLAMNCPFEKLFPSQLVKDEEFFMKLAYNQAIDAWNNGEVPIGAIIEHEGEVIAAAYNQVEKTKDPTAHAEILAITQAARKLDDWRLNNCRLFVTKEPCPMCSGASIMARLKHVYYGLEDEKMGCLGGTINISEIATLNHKLDTTSGILRDECKNIIQAFFQQKRLHQKNN